MLITKINKPNIQNIRNTLGFNKRLISVKYDENLDLLSFKFWDHSYRTPTAKEIDYFEMGKNDCDYGAFEVFAYRCIDGFNPEAMTTTEVIKKSQEIYYATLKFFKQSSKFQKFLSSHQQRQKRLMGEIKAEAHNLLTA